jgi:hypothetical protein
MMGKIAYKSLKFFSPQRTQRTSGKGKKGTAYFSVISVPSVAKKFLRLGSFAFLLLVILGVTLSSDCTAAAGTSERAQLATRKKQLESQIQTLKREHALLLFQKDMLDSDSKYLLLDMQKGAAQLRYKNRLLKEFSFKREKTRAYAAVEPGVLVLVKKEDGKQDRRYMQFGNVVLRSKRSSRSRDEAGTIAVTLSQKNLGAVFYAMEPGAQAYIVR